MDDSTRVGFTRVPAPLKFPIGAFLKKYGLRATRQRRGLARLLFGKGDRHLTAEALAAEARAANTRTSLATVYNVLNLFSEVGLVRSLAIEGDRTIFDTNTTDHSHYFYEDTKEVADIGPREMKFAEQIEAPEGYEISRIDCVVRLRKKAMASLTPAGVDAPRPDTVCSPEKSNSGSA